MPDEPVTMLNIVDDTRKTIRRMPMSSLAITMSKTKALKTASKTIYLARRGNGWAVIGPWRDSEPDGPVTEKPANDFWDARQKRARWVAQLALNLMGWSEAEANSDTYDHAGRAAEMVERAMEARKGKPMRVRDKIEAIRLADIALQGSGLTRPHVKGPRGERFGISYEAMSLSNAIHEHGEWRESFTRNDGNLEGQRAVASQAGMREAKPGIWRFAK